jgi:secernin
MFEKEGRLSVSHIFEILRDHGVSCTRTPISGLIKSDICMHAGFGPIRGNRTTGSMVVELLKDDIRVWFTGFC